MYARRRGVVVEVGETSLEMAGGSGLRRRLVVIDAETSVADIAATVALCASVVLGTPEVTIRLTR
jgi:hypothetical protein